MVTGCLSHSSSGVQGSLGTHCKAAWLLGACPVHPQHSKLAWLQSACPIHPQESKAGQSHISCAVNFQESKTARLQSASLVYPQILTRQLGYRVPVCMYFLCVRLDVCVTYIALGLGERNVLVYMNTV